MPTFYDENGILTMNVIDFLMEPKIWLKIDEICMKSAIFASKARNEMSQKHVMKTGVYA